MANKTQNLSLYNIDSVLNDNWQQIDSNVVNKNGTVPFTAEQIGIDPTSAQGLATKNYVDSKVINPQNITKADIGLGNVQNVDTTTTVNITDSIDKRFLNDTEKAILDKTSGINTGDETTDTIKTKLNITKSAISMSSSNFTTVANTPTKIPFSGATVWVDHLNEIDLANSRITWKSAGKKLLQMNLFSSIISDKSIMIYKNGVLYDNMTLYGKNIVYTTFFDNENSWKLGDYIEIYYNVPNEKDTMAFFIRSSILV